MKNSKNIQTTVDTGIFTPVRLGRYELPNRIVMAPMTRNRAGDGNIPQAMNAEYYAQRASAGLIITEGSQVSPQGVGYPGTPGIHDREQIAGWRQVTEAVHKLGGHIFLQLWHVGRISHPSLQPDGVLPVAPSAIRPEGKAITFDGLQPFVTPRALETKEIREVIAEFRTGAENALAAGFDGVEIHGANGYLLDQFLRDGTNQRSDEYGGSVENRARMLLEATEAVTEVWGGDRVGVRLSPINSFNNLIDSDPDAIFGFVAARLDQFRLAYLHVVENDFGGSQSRQTYDRQALRRTFTGNYIANGGYDKKRAKDSVVDGSADLVSFGNLYIANPDLPERFALNAELNVPDSSTFYGGNEIGYIDYPFLAHQPALVSA